MATDPAPDPAASEPAPVPEPAWDAWLTPQPWPSDQYDDPGSATSASQGFAPEVEPMTVEPMVVEPMAVEPLGSLPASLGKPVAYDEELSSLWPAGAQTVLFPGNAPGIGATTTEIAPAAGQEQPRVMGPIFPNVPAIAAPAPTAPLPPPVAGRKPPAPISSVLTPPRSSASSAGTTMTKALSSAVDAFRSAAASVAASATSAAEQALGTLRGGSAGPQEDPSQGTPQPVAPLAPPLGGSFFSLFGGGGGGQAGIGAGGVAPLLLAGILASVLALLRKDGRLMLISYEMLKPSSALLSPLERPG